MFLKYFAFMIAIGGSATGGPVDPFATSASRVLTQLPEKTWLESIAVRRNGDILATSLFYSSNIFTVSQPSMHAHNTAKILASVPEVNSLLGITELPESYGEEAFFFVGGNFTSLTTFTTVVGSFKGFRITFPRDGNPIVQKVSDLAPFSAFPNGVTAIPQSPGSVLVADSFVGAIGRLDLSTGHYDPRAFAFDEMTVPEGAKLPIGVSAMRMKGPYLYFGNPSTQSIFKVKVDSNGYLIKGAQPSLVANISSVAPGLDDFIFDPQGNILLATNSPENAIVHVDVRTGKSKRIIGGAG
ncbi:uncharacterized protein TrAtP1_009725 [Trichoderma atroviride]|uniref:uncharacterized protein n=1 Tax=Hypocrea atroviridis TaxID=63577 RepID=UPI003321D218|nr:hypothetical protein TrAtP1_009725 [Trichoderma atroviride]